MVSVTVHGGAGEVGGNKVLVEDGQSRLMLDFGTRMGYESQFFSEYLQPRSNASLRDRLTIGALPPVPGLYRTDLATPQNAALLDAAAGSRSLRSDSPYLGVNGLQTADEYRAAHGAPLLDAVLLSHAHLDHTGDLGFVDFSVPLIASPTTLTLLEAIDAVGKQKVEATKATLASFVQSSDNSTFPGAIAMDRSAGKRKAPSVTREARPIAPLAETRVGSFGVTAVPVDHSLPGASSFVIETRAGHRILYTGDIRFHGRAGPTMEEYARAVGRIDTMVCEGTRVDSRSVLTEDEVVGAIADEMGMADGLVLIDFAWKDTTRFETVLEASRRRGRTFVINSKLAYVLHSLGQEIPGDVRVFLPRKSTLTYSPADYTTSKHEYGFSVEPGAWHLDATHYEGGIAAEQIRADPSAYALMLGYYNFNSLFDLAGDSGRLPGSRMIKAVCEPFCDDMELDEERMLNWLDRFGVAYDEEPAGDGCGACGRSASRRSIRRNHVSGHASGHELAELIRRIGPSRVVPIHTENPGAFRAMLDGTGINVSLPETGRPVEL